MSIDKLTATPIGIIHSPFQRIEKPPVCRLATPQFEATVAAAEPRRPLQSRLLGLILGTWSR